MKITKVLQILCFSSFLTGCGTPDPMLHTDDSKGRSGWTQDKDDQEKASHESDSTSTKWGRSGTHEVEQK
jgi:hypothetical protein